MPKPPGFEEEMLITAKLLESTDMDDWNSFYLESGREMLDLAGELLGSAKKADVVLGLKIVNRSLFDEQQENPESPTGLDFLGFTKIFPALTKLLKDKSSAPEALNGIWVSLIHGAKAEGLDLAGIEAFLDDKKLKNLAFRILVHAYLQKDDGKLLLALVEKNKSLQSVLFDELGWHASHKYDTSAFLPLILKNLEAKGETPVRTGVDALWKLLTSSKVDISSAMAVVVTNEAKFGIFTDSNKLIAGYYLKYGKTELLKNWVLSPDPKQAARALRGLRMAHLQGIPADPFLEKTGLKAQLITRAGELRVPTLDEGL